MKAIGGIRIGVLFLSLSFTLLTLAFLSYALNQAVSYDLDLVYDFQFLRKLLFWSYAILGLAGRLILAPMERTGKKIVTSTVCLTCGILSTLTGSLFYAFLLFLASEDLLLLSLRHPAFSDAALLRTTRFARVFLYGSIPVALVTFFLAVYTGQWWLLAVLPINQILCCLFYLSSLAKLRESIQVQLIESEDLSF
ncbi:MAG: hypothetical protein WC314_24150 [Vulcanimicrobiota bacterium]